MDYLQKDDRVRFVYTIYSLLLLKYRLKAVYAARLIS